MRRLVTCVAVDIDGVLLRGGRALPSASKAILTLQKHGVPFVFVTNGGGCTELLKAQELSNKLDMQLDESLFLLSHTPFRDYASTYADVPVLIIGKSACLDVARSYGYRQLVTTAMLHATDPSIYPTLKSSTERESCPLFSELAAAFVYHDSTNWGLDAQTLLDTLLPRPRGEHQHDQGQCIPLYTSNSDLVYMADHAHPRLTQGAFLCSLRALYCAHCAEQGLIGQQLVTQDYGKPHPVQLEYAERMLQKQIGEKAAPQLRVAMIGDNPASDMRGAALRGPSWRGVLVRTGVYRGGSNTGQADAVVDDVQAAVEWVLRWRESD